MSNNHSPSSKSFNRDVTGLQSQSGNITNLHEISAFRDFVSSFKRTKSNSHSSNSVTQSRVGDPEIVSLPKSVHAPRPVHDTLRSKEKFGHDINDDEIIVYGVRVRVHHPTSWMDDRSLLTRTVAVNDVTSQTGTFSWDRVPFKALIHQFKAPNSTSKPSLDCESSSFDTFGTVGIQALLKSYIPQPGQSSVTPDDVQSMSAILNLKSDDYNWFSLFVLRYPLDLTWDVSRDESGNRIYIDLTTGRSQYSHPFLPSFSRLIADSLNGNQLHDVVRQLNPHIDINSEWVWFWAHELTPEWLAYMMSRTDEPSEGYFFNFKTGQVCVDARVIENENRIAQLRNMAAVKIQKVFRGYSGRSRLESQLEAIVRIQSVWRMWRTRSAFVANLIYTSTGWRREKKLFDWEQEWLGKVTRIQAFIRGWIVRWALRERTASAQRIEAVWLGIIARTRLRDRQIAAVEIQRIFRGYRSREKQKMHANACILIQSRIRGILTRKKFSIILAAIIRIQSRIRGILARRFMLARDDAAVKIQSFIRRYIALFKFRQRVLAKLIDCRNSIMDIVRTKTETVSAVAIQSQFRRHFARKRFVYLKRDRIEKTTIVKDSLVKFVLSLCSVRDPKHSWIQYLDDSEKRLVRTFQRRIETMNLEQLAAELVSVFEWTARGSTRWILHACIHLISSTLDLASPSRSSNLFILISQCGVSRWVPDVTLETLVFAVLTNARNIIQDERVDLATNLAVVGFGANRCENLVRQVAADLDHLAVPVSDLSKNLSRSNCQELVDRVMHYVQGSREGNVTRRQDEKIHLDDILLVVRQLMESATSRNQGKDLPEMKNKEILSVILLHSILHASLVLSLRDRAAVTIQCVYKWWMKRQFSRKYRNPCILIQRVWRGCMQRRRWMCVDLAVRRIQRNMRILIGLRRNKQLVAGIVRIQSGFRGHVQREWIRELHASARTIQKIFRGHLVRLIVGSRDMWDLRKQYRVMLMGAADEDERRMITDQYFACLEEKMREKVDRKWGILEARRDGKNVTEKRGGSSWQTSHVLTKNMIHRSQKLAPRSLTVTHLSRRINECLSSFIHLGKVHAISRRGYMNSLKRLQKGFEKVWSRNGLCNLMEIITGSVPILSVYKYCPSFSPSERLLNELTSLVAGSIIGVTYDGFVPSSGPLQNHPCIIALHVLEELLARITKISFSSQILSLCLKTLFPNELHFSIFVDLMTRWLIIMARSPGHDVREKLALRNRKEDRPAIIKMISLLDFVRHYNHLVTKPIDRDVGKIVECFESIINVCSGSLVCRACIFGFIMRAICTNIVSSKESLRGIDSSWESVKPRLYGDPRKSEVAALCIQSSWRGFMVRRHWGQVKRLMQQHSLLKPFPNVSKKQRTKRNDGSEPHVMRPLAITAEHYACARLWFLWVYTQYRRDCAFAIFEKLIWEYFVVFSRFTELVCSDPKIFELHITISERMRQDRIEMKRDRERDKVVQKKVKVVPESVPKISTMFPPDYMSQYKRFMDGDDSMLRDIAAGEVEVLWKPRSRRSDNIELVWVPVKTSRFNFGKEKLVGKGIKVKYDHLERDGDFVECLRLLTSNGVGGFHLELVFVVGVGYLAQCVKEGKEQLGASLVQELLGLLPASLDIDVSLTSTHKAMIEAMVLDACVGFAYAFPAAVELSEVGKWFDSIAKIHEKVYVSRYTRSCVRYACFLALVGNYELAIETCNRVIDRGDCVRIMHVIAQMNKTACLINLGHTDAARLEWRNIACIVIPYGDLKSALREVGKRINNE